MQDARAFNWDSIAPVNVTTADPAANTNPNGFAATTRRTLFLAAAMTFVTGVGVADRSITCTLTYGSAAGIRTVTSTTVQAASLTRRYRFVYGITQGTEVTSYDEGGVAFYIGLGLTPDDLPIGSVLSFVINNLDATDNVSATVYTVKVAPA